MVFLSDTDILGGIDTHSPKKQNKKKTTLVVKRRSMIILEVNVKKKVNCVFKIFLNVFYSHPVPDYTISMFVFLVLKVHFSQSEAFNFQNFLGKHALEAKKFSAMKQREFWGLNSSAPLLIPFRCP